MLARSLLDMVAAGLIEDVDVDSFNLPFYTPPSMMPTFSGPSLDWFLSALLLVWFLPSLLCPSLKALLLDLLNSSSFQELYTIFLILCMAFSGSGTDFIGKPATTDVMKFGAVGNGVTDDSRIDKIISSFLC
ncbi:hypothetical protein F0562_018306 [Nyssa sinensis]|uniref:Uncharacterized protein n=1 Tax=Nyssa sinensis TaxID=561372 RepID=A0A5J4ZCZ2_9ASTE|nr:hypothetical protein F0562_018306 [Nyssa sinensis]